ncbi:ABC transporter permease [Hominifimenecus sp. rT4P-3]|uniref:ABC transporter permease n=1 Tax=Hominifimenecus sp. rT4P-3 TaxID=3242979 RepID=UPI003DA4A7D4
MSRKLLAGPYLLWMICCTVVPLGMIVYYGLTDRSGAFTLANLSSITVPAHAKALGLALLLAVISTLICLILAYPLGLILRKSGLGQKGFVVFLFILPMWMNFLLRTMAWQTILEKHGVINNLFSFLGLPNMRLINTPAAIVMGMVYDFLPFMVLPIYNVLMKIDDSVVEAARDLGASNRQILFQILIPLSVPGIVSGITMVFIPSLTTFVIPNMLGGGKVLLIGNIIDQEFTVGSNWHLGSGLSLVMMVFILISMLVLAKFDKSGEGNAF